MREVSVIQASSGVRVATRAMVADSWWGRLRGLLRRPPLEAGQGMLLMRCGSIHTVGMAHPIDIAFLDADGRVVRRLERLRPWRVGFGGPTAEHALELPAGRLEETGTAPGDRLSWS